MDAENEGQIGGPSLSWRRALVFFVVVGIVGWAGIAGLIYASTVAWDVIAGRSNDPAVQDIQPAAGAQRR